MSLFLSMFNDELVEIAFLGIFHKNAENIAVLFTECDPRGIVLIVIGL